MTGAPTPHGPPHPATPARTPGRPSGRQSDQLRNVVLEPGFARHAEGSCFVRFGDTHVLVTASVEDRPPPFLKGTGQGWVTAEYGMLPRSTHTRTDREAARGKQSGRTLEIQRLVGRALRAIVDRRALGELQIKLDCDVIQADGGTRTAAITGGYVALHQACQHLIKIKAIGTWPLVDSVAAVSCGIWRGQPLLDLDYLEDSGCDTDANFVITGRGLLVEVQASAEGNLFSETELTTLLTLARKGTSELTALQATATGQPG